MFAQLIRFYHFSESELLKMPMRRVYMYFDYMNYIKRWENGDEKARKLNEKLDFTDKRKYMPKLKSHERSRYA